ncbi:MAG TPA: CHY zinc finger protein [Pseudogracilibacillus sp.]|nr:CHY zinc finger protein [Pseudogracilibacillus sp.]
MVANHIEVSGVGVDRQYRCQHYHKQEDIVAIKFKCCQTYYACYQCHELEAHATERWDKTEFQEKALLCGACKSEFTIYQYVNGHAICPVCHTAHNPACKDHFHLYFDLR